MGSDMNFNKLEKKILEILNNLDSIVISNRIKAQTIREEVEKLVLLENKFLFDSKEESSNVIEN